VLCLTTNVIVTLFLQALTYNLTNPDDGTCPTWDNEESCTRAPSAFADGSSKCYWVAGNRRGLCYFSQPKNNFRVMLFVALFAALVSIPIVVAVELLAKRVLSARIKKIGMSKVAAAALHSNRRLGIDSLRKHDASAHSTDTRRRSLVEALGFSTDTNSLDTTLQQDLANLVNGLRRHRETLSAEQQSEFDNLWGLDEAGIFLTSSEQQIAGPRAWLSTKNIDVQEMITDDIKQVRENVCFEIEAMHATGESNRQHGQRLMLLFQSDLMSELNGQILASRGTRVSQIVREVSLVAKVAAWCFVLLMNACMLFYIFIFAIQQTSDRQDAWLKSFLIWLISEVFIVSSFVCILQHLVIPHIVIKDIKFIKQRVLDTIRDYKDSLHFDKERGTAATTEFDCDGSKFNAANILFVSYRVAQKFPHLKESQIIKRFATQWPRKSYKRKTKEVESSYNAVGQAIGRSVAMVVMYLVANLLNLPAGIQDVVLQALSTATLGSFALLHVRMYGILPLFVLLPTIVVACVIHFWVQSGKRKDIIKLAQTKPFKDMDIQERQKHPGDAGWRGNYSKSFGLKQSAGEDFGKKSHNSHNEDQDSKSINSNSVSSSSVTDSLSENSIRQSEKVGNFQPIRRAIRYGETLLSEIVRLHSFDEKRKMLARHAQIALESIGTEEHGPGSDKANSNSDNGNNSSGSENVERHTFIKISGARKFTSPNINNETDLLTKAHIRAADWGDSKLVDNIVSPYESNGTSNIIDFGAKNTDISASSSSTDSDDDNNQIHLHSLKITRSLEKRKQKQKQMQKKKQILADANHAQSVGTAPNHSVSYIRRLMKEHLRSELSDDSDSSFPQISPQSSIDSSLSYNSDEPTRNATFKTQKLRHIVRQSDDNPILAEASDVSISTQIIPIPGSAESISLAIHQDVNVLDKTRGITNNNYPINDTKQPVAGTEEGGSLVSQHGETLSRIEQMREQIAQRKLNKLREKEVLIAAKKVSKKLAREDVKKKERNERKDGNSSISNTVTQSESLAGVAAAPLSTRDRIMEQRKLRLAGTGQHL
jgi:hypothetical protein